MSGSPCNLRCWFDYIARFSGNGSLSAVDHGHFSFNKDGSGVEGDEISPDLEGQAGHGLQYHIHSLNIVILGDLFGMVSVKKNFNHIAVYRNRPIFVDFYGLFPSYF